MHSRFHPCEIFATQPPLYSIIGAVSCTFFTHVVCQRCISPIVDYLLMILWGQASLPEPYEPVLVFSSDKNFRRQ